MDSFSVIVIPILVIAVVSMWGSHLFLRRSFNNQRRMQFFFVAVFLACAAALFAVLRFWAADDVRSDPWEIFLYLIVSLGWLTLVQAGFAFLGISLRDDVGERANSAAAFAAAGLTIGAMFCAAGANVGNGPGFEIVVFCMALSTGALLLLWFAFDAVTGVAETITVERDTGAGIRAGGLLAASGLILGISVAGDWVSTRATLWDFVRFAWPVLVVFAVLSTFEKRKNMGPLSGRPSRALSGTIAAAMIVGSAIYAKWVGLR